jgi:hypothetical protein
MSPNCTCGRWAVRTSVAAVNPRCPRWSPRRRTGAYPPVREPPAGCAYGLGLAFGQRIDLALDSVVESLVQSLGDGGVAAIEQQTRRCKRRAEQPVLSGACDVHSSNTLPLHNWQIQD